MGFTTGRARRGVAAIAVGIGLIVASSGTARADESDILEYSGIYWDGAGDLDDDFADHFGEIGTLCNGCANSQGTRTVGMWQTMLYAEGWLLRSGIDGYFGAQTEVSTRAFQRYYGLSVDGKVGPETWGEAADHLEWNSGRTQIFYEGLNGVVYLERGNSAHGNPGGNGRYRFQGVYSKTYGTHWRWENALISHIG